MITDRIYRGLKSAPRLQNFARRVVHRLPHRSRLVEHRGQRLYVDPAEMSGFYLYYERSYDDEIFAFLDRRPRYRTILDVGANIGVYTSYFATRADRVIAFEPFPSVCKELRRNLAINGLDRVFIVEACISSQPGEAQFVTPESSNIGIGSLAGTGGTFTVTCRTLDEFYPDLCRGRCLIKLDIEGAELLAIQGARRVLGPECEAEYLIEVHPEQICSLGGTVDALKTTLQDAGYTIEAFTPAGLVPLEAFRDARHWWAARV